MKKPLARTQRVLTILAPSLIILAIIIERFASWIDSCDQNDFYEVDRRVKSCSANFDYGRITNQVALTSIFFIAIAIVSVSALLTSIIVNKWPSHSSRRISLKLTALTVFWVLVFVITQIINNVVMFSNNNVAWNRLYAAVTVMMIIFFLITVPAAILYAIATRRAGHN